MATTATPLPYWKVLKPHLNGAKLAGKKGRKLNDVFQAPEPLVRFQAMEGIVGECDVHGVLKLAVTPPAAPSGSGSGSSGSTGGTGGSV